MFEKDNKSQATCNEYNRQASNIELLTENKEYYESHESHTILNIDF